MPQVPAQKNKNQKGMVVQTLILSKDRFKTVAEAKAWIKENNFKDYGVDETDNSYRFRQRNPEEFQTGSMRTFEVTNGVKAVGGRLKNTQASNVTMAVWDTAFINDLPDAAFAIILPGGEKDDTGKTKPRTLRKLPHHNKNVKNPNEDSTIDYAHLINAIQRLPQTNMPSDAKEKARKHLESHYNRIKETKKAAQSTKKENDKKELSNIPKFYFDLSTIQLQDSKDDKKSESKSAWVEMMSPVKDQEHGFFGKITITSDDIKRYENNFNSGIATKANELPIDYWHTPYREAAGWLKKVEIRNDNILWGLIEFTPRAVKMIQDKEVRFFSPQYSEEYKDSDGKVTKNVLTGGGLTNLPFLNNSPISLSENFSMVIDQNIKSEKKGVEYSMDVIQLSDGRAIRAVDFLDMERKLSEAEEARQEAETKADEAEAKVEEKTEEAKQLSDKIALAEKEKEDAEWENVFKQLSDEGKATPGMKESLKAKFTSKELAEFGKTMPKVLSEGKVAGTSKGDNIQLSEAESHAMKTFGYTEDQIREGRGE